VLAGGTAGGRPAVQEQMFGRVASLGDCASCTTGQKCVQVLPVLQERLDGLAECYGELLCNDATPCNACFSPEQQLAGGHAAQRVILMHTARALI
jgi:hypothetical protein